jgi:hypothetical protein
MYYDFDLSLSGTFHPSRLLTTQLMGKDTFLKLLPKTSNGIFEGTLLSMSLYDKVPSPPPLLLLLLLLLLRI